MENHISLYQFKNNSLGMDVACCAVVVLLVASVFCYSIFNFKIYIQNQRIDEINSRISLYIASEHQLHEGAVLDYKKKVDDFALILSNHKITSNIFSFIEENTLPKVWFSNFSIEESLGELRLSGETESMETLSRQVQVFEKKTDSIKSITVLDSQTGSSGKVSFTLSATLVSDILNDSYMTPAEVAPPSAGIQ
jgi:hypothetical protein